MVDPIPTYAQEGFAVLYNRFAKDEFPANYLGWFISRSMSKKTLYVLEKAGWIRRMEKGRYVCIEPDSAFRSMVQFKVPDLLKEADRKYAYTEASAAEIWTDFTYIQRSWEHSPYYVKVSKNELNEWEKYFARHRVNTFVDKAGSSLGEFVILKPQSRLSPQMYSGLPVDSLEETTRYCEKHIDSFEYPLAYLKAKFHVKTGDIIDKRVLEEASKMV